MGFQKQACEKPDGMPRPVFCKKRCQLPRPKEPLQFRRQDNNSDLGRTPARSGERRPQKGLEGRVVELEKAAPDRFRLWLAEDVARPVRGPVLPAAERDSPSPDFSVGPDVQSGVPPRATRIERPHLDGHRTAEPRPAGSESLVVEMGRRMGLRIVEPLGERGERKKAAAESQQDLHRVPYRLTWDRPGQGLHAGFAIEGADRLPGDKRKKAEALPPAVRLITAVQLPFRDGSRRWEPRLARTHFGEKDHRSLVHGGSARGLHWSRPERRLPKIETGQRLTLPEGADQTIHSPEPVRLEAGNETSQPRPDL